MREESPNASKRNNSERFAAAFWLGALVTSFRELDGEKLPSASDRQGLGATIFDTFEFKLDLCPWRTLQGMNKFEVCFHGGGRCSVHRKNIVARFNASICGRTIWHNAQNSPKICGRILLWGARHDDSDETAPLKTLWRSNV